MRLNIYYDENESMWVVDIEHQYPLYFDSKKEALDYLDDELGELEKKRFSVEILWTEHHGGETIIEARNEEEAREKAQANYSDYKDEVLDSYGYQTYVSESSHNIGDVSERVEKK